MYVLTHRLGAGGMGEVYAAQKRGLPEPLPVAVKILRPELAKFEQLVDLFNKEAVTAWRVNHEHMHLVTVYDFGVMDDGIPYLIMEKVDGVRLDYLERDPGAGYSVTRRIAYDLLNALEHLHSHRLIHRDVTPRNVLISAGGVAKLTDLGLVKEQHGSLTGCFAGTPAYASPEALQCRRMTPASDLYSLGAVLYERMTGAKPWGEGRPDDILTAMVSDERIPLPDDVPQDLADLVEALMAFDQEQRLETAAEAIEMLDGPMAGDADLAALVACSPQPEPDPTVPEFAYPFRARPPAPEASPEPEPATPRRRGSLTAIALACVLVLGGVGLGFGLGRTGRTGAATVPTATTTAPAATTTALATSAPVVSAVPAIAGPPHTQIPTKLDASTEEATSRIDEAQEKNTSKVPLHTRRARRVLYAPSM